MSEQRPRVQDLLDEVFQAEAHEQWLNHPQRAWRGKSAQQMIDSGNAVIVESYLDALAEGVVM